MLPLALPPVAAADREVSPGIQNQLPPHPPQTFSLSFAASSVSPVQPQPQQQRYKHLKLCSADLSATHNSLSPACQTSDLLQTAQFFMPQNSSTSNTLKRSSVSSIAASPSTLFQPTHDLDTQPFSSKPRNASHSQQKQIQIYQQPKPLQKKQLTSPKTRLNTLLPEITYDSFTPSAQNPLRKLHSPPPQTTTTTTTSSSGSTSILNDYQLQRVTPQTAIPIQANNFNESSRSNSSFAQSPLGSASASTSTPTSTSETTKSLTLRRNRQIKQLIHQQQQQKQLELAPPDLQQQHLQKQHHFFQNYSSQRLQQQQQQQQLQHPSNNTNAPLAASRMSLPDIMPQIQSQFLVNPLIRKKSPATASTTTSQSSLQIPSGFNFLRSSISPSSPSLLLSQLQGSSGGAPSSSAIAQSDQTTEDMTVIMPQSHLNQDLPINKSHSILLHSNFNHNNTNSQHYKSPLLGNLTHEHHHAHPLTLSHYTQSRINNESSTSAALTPSRKVIISQYNGITTTAAKSSHKSSSSLKNIADTSTTVMTTPIYSSNSKFTKQEYNNNNMNVSYSRNSSKSDLHLPWSAPSLHLESLSPSSSTTLSSNTRLPHQQSALQPFSSSSSQSNTIQITRNHNSNNNANTNNNSNNYRQFRRFIDSAVDFTPINNPRFKQQQQLQQQSLQQQQQQQQQKSFLQRKPQENILNKIFFNGTPTTVAQSTISSIPCD